MKAVLWREKRVGQIKEWNNQGLSEYKVEASIGF